MMMIVMMMHDDDDDDDNDVWWWRMMMMIDDDDHDDDGDDDDRKWSLMCLWLMIVEYEASHGTVSDLWHAHLRGEPTSLNPLGKTSPYIPLLMIMKTSVVSWTIASLLAGLIEALVGAMNHSADLAGGEIKQETKNFTTLLMKAVHNTFR